LLRDPENDVRIAAVKSMKDFLHLIYKDQFAILIPSITQLLKDPVKEVRKLMASNLKKITNVLSHSQLL